MLNIVIDIDTQKVYDEVYAITSHTGKAAGNIDGISLSEDEIRIIEPFMKESTGELGDILSYYGTLSVNSDKISVSLSMPSNWKESLKDSLSQCISNYISNSICQRWFSISDKEDVKYYADKVLVNEKNINKILSEREKPQRQ